jgi:hypothetical protein
MKINRFLIFVSTLFMVTLIVHMGFVFHFAVDMPILDELAFLDLWQKGTGLSYDYIVFQHSDSRAIFTRLFGYISLHLTDYHFYFDIVLNFSLLLAIVVLFLFFNRRLGLMPATVVLGFSLFLLSPISDQLHFSRICNQWRFFSLMAFLSAYMFFRNRQSPLKDLVIGTVFASLSLFSFIAGLAASLFLMTYKTFFLVLDRQLLSKKDVAGWMGCWVAYIASIALFFQDYWFTHSEKVFPWTWMFWDHYLNLIAFGFNGMSDVSWALGALDLALILTPIILLARTHWTTPQFRIPSALVLLLLAAMALISMGRSKDGPEWAKVSRYVETSILLIVPTAMLWWTLLRNRPWRSYALGGGFAFIFMFYLDDWDFYVYTEVNRRLTQAQQCAADYYKNGGELKCRALDSRDVAQLMDTGRRLNLHFYQVIQQTHLQPTANVQSQ